jgi:hypothetical protein
MDNKKGLEGSVIEDFESMSKKKKAVLGAGALLLAVGVIDQIDNMPEELKRDIADNMRVVDNKDAYNDEIEVVVNNVSDLNLTINLMILVLLWEPIGIMNIILKMKKKLN